MITKKITEVQNFANGDLGTIIQVQGDEIGQTNVSALKQDITNSVVTELMDSGGASLNLINLKGVVPTYGDLPTVDVELNDAYQVEADGLVYVYTENGFQADGEGFLVQPEPDGVVEEGNPNAVSGGEVYNYVKPIYDITKNNSNLFLNDNTQFLNRGYDITSGVIYESLNLIGLPRVTIKPEWIGKNVTISGFGIIPTGFAFVSIKGSEVSDPVVFEIAGEGSAGSLSPKTFAITQAMAGLTIGFTVAQSTNIDPQDNPYIDSFKANIGETPIDFKTVISGDNVEVSTDFEESGITTNDLIRAEIDFINEIRIESPNLFDNSTMLPNGYTLDGNIGETNNIIRTPRIRVKEEWKNQKGWLSGYGLIPTGFLTVAIWDNSGTLIYAKPGLGSGGGTAPISFDIQSNAYEIGFTPYQGTNVALDPTNSPVKNTLMFNIGESALNWVSFDDDFIDGEKIKFKEPLPEPDELLLFLNDRIPVAVGRTIEMYHNQILWTGNRDAYHFHWSGVGQKLKRKLSITPTIADIGEKDLTCNILNKNNKAVLSKSIKVDVVSNVIPSELKVLPIGDSLTNRRPWLSEITNNLSGGNIEFVGSRFDPNNSTYMHEGRSGTSGAWWIADSNYTGDSDGIDGNDGRSQSKNPFWNPITNDIDFEYYLDNYNIDRPDIITIWLGTNGLNYDPTNNATNIKTFIDKLRASGASGIPIILMHTLIWADQNGIAFQGNSDGFQSSSNYWKLQQDRIIFNLAFKLVELLEGYSDLHFCPLITCHDSEFNFGEQEVQVNPRNPRTEIMPLQAVHPHAVGYLQCADVIYSNICYVVNG